MLLVAGSGTDKAEATKIVSDLRSLKAAALMYYADNPNVDLGTNNEIEKLKKYMDRDLPTANYEFVEGTVASADAWFVGRIAIPDTGVREKLKDVAASTGLLKDNAVAGEAIASTDLYTTNEGTVYLRAR